MLRKIISSLLFAAFLTPVFAQDSAKAVTEEAEAPKGFTISGTADMYYRYDFAKTKANNDSTPSARGTRVKASFVKPSMAHLHARIDLPSVASIAHKEFWANSRCLMKWGEAPAEPRSTFDRSTSNHRTFTYR